MHPAAAIQQNAIGAIGHGGAIPILADEITHDRQVADSSVYAYATKRVATDDIELGEIDVAANGDVAGRSHTDSL